MIFQTQTQTKNTYDKIFKMFEERSKRDHYKHHPDDDYSHVFLAVNNYDKKEPPYYCVSELNNNFPELVEQLIWEHLVDISEDELTEDEVRAHYNWILKRISDICVERIEKARKDGEA